MQFEPLRAEASLRGNDVAQVFAAEGTDATLENAETESDEVEIVQQPIKKECDMIWLSSESEEEVDVKPVLNASTFIFCPMCKQPQPSATRLAIHILDQHSNSS